MCINAHMVYEHILYVSTCSGFTSAYLIVFYFYFLMDKIVLFPNDKVKTLL